MSYRRVPADRRGPGRALRGALAVVLGATGLALVPTPRVELVTDFRADRETLRFTPVAHTASAAADPVAGEGSAPVVVASEVAEVEPFTTIGVVLPEAPVAPVEVRWRDGAGWSAWHELEVEPDKGPDLGTDEAARAASDGVASQPLWVGDADAYQVRVPVAPSAGPPTSATDRLEGAEVVVVREAGTRAVVEVDDVPAGAAAGQPAIRSRAEWGARSPANSVGTASELKLAVVHHSATGNDYAPGDVPGIIRSIQAFHMDANGWSDIGYNFVVDRFGGMWEGRDGSLLRNSIGAHAEGFNTGSVGVVALGNFSAGRPGTAQVANIAEVIGWRFALAGIDPASTVRFTSGGSSTIPAGRAVDLPRVVGHRDVGSTDCPGSNLYAQLSSTIRPRLPAIVAEQSSPVGFLDVVAAGPRSVLLAGWAVDPLVRAPIEVHAYVDGVGYNLGPTRFARPDVSSRFSTPGVPHGFVASIGDLAPGRHSVCVFAINAGPGSNTLVLCQEVVVESGDPIGAVDQIEAGPDGSLRVAGWTLDPDLAGANEVHVYIDGVGVNLGPAAGARPDIGRLRPAYGSAHGFDWRAGGLAPGPHSVCVFAINAGPGSNRLLQCRTVTTPGGRPIGVLDAVTGLPDGRIAASGWAIDPDTAAPAEVHLYVDGRGVNLGPAAGDRPDLAAAFPGYGPRHGFGWLGTGFAPGRHRVCAFGIDVAGGPNSLLGCRDAVVPGGDPFGVVDRVYATGSGIGVSGWVVDPDTVAPVSAHVYIDGVGYDAGPAGADRPDVGAATGYGARHGLEWRSPPLAAGPHDVCTFGIDVGVGSNVLLDCRRIVL